MSSDQRARDLMDLGNKLYGDKLSLDSLLQNIAENFYPERADFTRTIILGEDFAGQLMDTYPVLMHRELSNSISAMLRPRDSDWFRLTTLIDDLDSDDETGKFLEYLKKETRAGLYDPRASFVRATKQADYDFTAFGQAILSIEQVLDKKTEQPHLYFKCHHFRDCAFLENDLGEIDHLHRKDSLPARAMVEKFSHVGKLSDKVLKAAEKEPNKSCPFRVIVMPSDEYDLTSKGGKKGGKKLPFVCIYVDADEGKMIYEHPLQDFLYVVPRWHMISTSQYAFSPAAITALPDARMAQDLSRIILESGEKQVDPPLIATEDAVREVNIQAGAVTWADYAYDERLGEALRPLNLNHDMRTGFAMRQDVREILTKAFWVDKLQLPDTSSAKTAYEISQRIQEHVRNLLPLFEPMEMEYNVRLLERSFSALRNMGKIDLSQAPNSLRGRDITWAFESPIQQNAKRLKTQQFSEVLQLIQAAKQMGVMSQPTDLDRGLHDAIVGTGAPAAWSKSQMQLQAEAQQRAQAQAMEVMASMVQRGSEMAGHVADSSQRIDQAMQGAPEGANAPKPVKAKPLKPQKAQASERTQRLARVGAQMPTSSPIGNAA